MIDKFLRKYQDHRFEDWGSTCSDDFKAFTRGFKSYLKRTLSGDCELIGFKSNHYYFSGFVKHGNVYVYVNYEWDRSSPVDVLRSGCAQGVLVRYAKDDKDFHGETNEFTSLKEAAEYITNMFVRRREA